MFTFPKHVSQLAWQLRVTRDVHTADAIPSRLFGWSAIFHLHGNGIRHFNLGKMAVYPLLELTGAELIIPGDSNCWHLHSH